MALTYSSFLLPVGAKIPAFHLENFGTKGAQHVSHTDIMNSPTVIVFMCNHCPYVHHVMPALASLSRTYKGRVNFIGINSNNIDAYPEDHPNLMLPFLQKYDAEMPYLFDETQAIAKAFGAECTPDAFVFNTSGILVYRGAIDQTRIGAGNSDGTLINEAIEHMETSTGPLHISEHPSMGCGIKWK